MDLDLCLHMLLQEEDVADGVSGSVEPASQPRGIPSLCGGHNQRSGREGRAGSAASREWDAFVAASKTSQVKDVWDVRGADLGPRASKKQLEEMTAKFRAATEGVKDWKCGRHSI